ncbi:MAG TPA: hypothetical protein VM389_12785, partial [Phycisphaerae bacterium]|nr:hypothetical protein [Phycisphaerae bacterium]
ATWASGDFNGDGAVGIADLVALADNYGDQVGGRGLSPEPAPAETGGRGERPDAETVMPPDVLEALAPSLAVQAAPAGTGKVKAGEQAGTITLAIIRVVLPAAVGTDPGSVGQGGDGRWLAAPIDAWTHRVPAAMEDSLDLLAAPELSVLPAAAI